jgi:hypothetical protein
MVLDRLNRARFLWDRPGDRPQPAPASPLMESPFATPPKISLAPMLPELAAPPRPHAEPAAAVAVSAATAAPALEAAPAPEAAEAPPPRPVPPPRAMSVSLTPEERADLGAFSWIEPASADRSLPVPANLDEVEVALVKAKDLEEVGQTLLGFLGRTHRRAALFQATRDRVTGWKVHGSGIDREAFAGFSIGFDQPSLFLNLRHGNNVYLGPLPPMPAHRELARTWGGEMPRDCVLLPVRIKDRLVMIIYADGATKGSVELAQMQRLMALATSAVERCILQRKRGEPKS